MRHLTTAHRNESGFSLIELLVVVIIGILAAYLPAPLPLVRHHLRRIHSTRYGMIEFVKTTWYFEERVLKIKRPYLKRDWCEAVVRGPVRIEVQSDGRIRHWAFVEELGRYLRVVTLEDGETIHNAMPDRRFKE